MDGATRVFINAFDVVPGTTYTLTIRIADVGDANYDSIAFVSASSIINNPPALDLSVAASGTGYTTTWVQGSGPVAIAATDDKISDDGTTISSATLTLSSPGATDLLGVGALPATITASAYDSLTGLLTLTGVATLAEYSDCTPGYHLFEHCREPLRTCKDTDCQCQRWRRQLEHCNNHNQRGRLECHKNSRHSHSRPRRQQYVDRCG